jgi:FMN reductase
MADEADVVGIGGSLSENSSSLAALKIALDGAAEDGVTTRLFDVRELDLPMYRPDRTETPAAAEEMTEAIYAARGLIWSSPLYHGTISGSFKNVLDWVELLARRDPPYLSDKVVGLISTAGGVQGLQALNTMEFIVRSLRGWAVPLAIPVARAGRVFDDEGNPLDEGVERQLRLLGSEVASVCLTRRSDPSRD